MSMDFNLVDSQVRYIFQGSPIVGPITIQETESAVIILVATVTSVNRFIFTHPKRLPEVIKKLGFFKIVNYSYCALFFLTEHTNGKEQQAFNLPPDLQQASNDFQEFQLVRACN
jgi:hypothetical protein